LGLTSLSSRFSSYASVAKSALDALSELIFVFTARLRSNKFVQWTLDQVDQMSLRKKSPKM
jgi:hypothetical protein